MESIGSFDYYIDAYVVKLELSCDMENMSFILLLLYMKVIVL